MEFSQHKTKNIVFLKGDTKQENQWYAKYMDVLFFQEKGITSYILEIESNPWIILIDKEVTDRNELLMIAKELLEHPENYNTSQTFTFPGKSPSFIGNN